MSRKACLVVALGALVGAGCVQQGAARTNPDAGFTFQAGPARGLRRQGEEHPGRAAADRRRDRRRSTADPSALGALVDGWMALPEYQAKMMVFFELAFQQTQITAADFTDMIPPTGSASAAQMPLLLQNLRESFARTVLALVAAGPAAHRRVHHQAADDDAGADGALRVPRHAPRRRRRQDHRRVRKAPTRR